MPFHLPLAESCPRRRWDLSGGAQPPLLPSPPLLSPWRRRGKLRSGLSLLACLSNNRAHGLFPVYLAPIAPTQLILNWGAFWFPDRHPCSESREAASRWPGHRGGGGGGHSRTWGVGPGLHYPSSVPLRSSRLGLILHPSCLTTSPWGWGKRIPHAAFLANPNPAFGSCAGLNSAPHKIYVCLEPQNMAFLGHRVFADVKVRMEMRLSRSWGCGPYVLIRDRKGEARGGGAIETQQSQRDSLEARATWSP